MATHRLLLTALCFSAVICLVHANRRANHSQKTITSLSCGFSVNEVPTSSPCNTNLQQVFKLLDVDVDSDRVLIGSTECLYVLDRNLMYINSTELPLEGLDLNNCKISNPQEGDFLCKNYITYWHGVNETTARVCGTYDSRNPRCWTCQYNGTSCNGNHLTQFMQRTPTENFTVTVATDGSQDYYYLGGLDSGIGDPDKILARVEVKLEDVPSAKPETNTNKENFLKTPTNFVGSIERGEFIYFFYRERAIEYENLGQIIYSRVARVCKNDAGGTTNPLTGEFTTFLKTRLMCSVGSEFPFIFNEIQDVVQSPRDENIIYGLFTTPSAGSSSTAICRYNMTEVDNLFNQDKRRGQATDLTLWQSVDKLAEDTEASRSCSAEFHVDAYFYLASYTLLNTNAPNCGLEATCGDYSRATNEALAVFEGIRGQQLAVFNESSDSIQVYVGTNNNTIYEASIDANEVLITRQIELEVDSVDETQKANKWPFGVSYLEANGEVIYGTLDNVAFRFDPAIKEDLKILDRSPDVSSFTFPININDARIQIFKLFEGPAGSDINATFSGGLENHDCSQQVLKSTGAGKREFLHILCEIEALSQNIDGIITVSSPMGSISDLKVTVNVTIDNSDVMTKVGIAEEVKQYDEDMAKYRYSFRQWLANLDCTDGVKDTCPAAGSPGC